MARWSEGNKAAVKLALRGVEPILDERFERLAHTIFDPLREHAIIPGATP